MKPIDYLINSILKYFIMKTYSVESNLSGTVTVYYTNVNSYDRAIQLRDALKLENPKRVYYVKKEQ